MEKKILLKLKNAQFFIRFKNLDKMLDLNALDFNK